MFARLLLVSSLLGGLLCAATPALADGSNVVVLGLRSVEGDDDVANDLTLKLREAVGSAAGWTLSPTSVSMSQMSLAHGCDELDATCLADIATGLQADRIIYGTLRRSSARDDYDYALGVSLFDATEGTIAKQMDHTIPRGESGAAGLGPHVALLMKRLTSTSQGGVIAVEANVESALVTINGQPVGHTTEAGLRLEGLRDGQYRIEVSKEGYTTHEATVTIADGAETAIAAVLTEPSVMAAVEAQTTAPPPSGHKLEWLGWTLVGVGGAALIGTGVAMLRIKSIDDDDLLNTYRGQVAIGNVIAREEGTRVYTDVCDAAKAGLLYDLERSDITEVADLCSEADVWEVLQYVFAGTAVAAAGVGVYLILTSEPDGGETARSDAPQLSLQPRFGYDSAQVSATLRF